MDDQQFRQEVVAHISAIEAVVTVLAKSYMQPEFLQAVTKALSQVTDGIDLPVHYRAQSIVHRMMGVED